MKETGNLSVAAFLKFFELYFPLNGVERNEVIDKFTERKIIKGDQKLKTMPVIIMSAEFAIAKIAQECGAEGYLAKPFDIDNLYQLLMRYIKNDDTPEILSK